MQQALLLHFESRLCTSEIFYLDLGFQIKIEWNVLTLYGSTPFIIFPLMVYVLQYMLKSFFMNNNENTNHLSFFSERAYFIYY
jgi:hypothetical protein